MRAAELGRVQSPTSASVRPQAAAARSIAAIVNMTRELGRAADQLTRVLKSAKPNELPVDTSTEYELVVNKKAAAALGIAIPTSILRRANRVIE